MRLSVSRSNWARCSAARAANVSTRVASSSVPESNAMRPSRRLMPSPRSRRPGERCRGPSSPARSRAHRSDVIQVTALAASPRLRTSTSASAAPTRRATVSWSCSASWSDFPLVTRWSATRASSRRVLASARRSGSPAWRYPRATRMSTPPAQPGAASGPGSSAQPTQPADCTSRSPPAPSLRFGASISAMGPGRSSRARDAVASCSISRPRRRGTRRRTLVSSSATRSASPATRRTSSSAVIASRSSSARSSASFTVRTECPRTNPPSHSGYHNRPAASTGDGDRRPPPACRSITSMSDPGHSSRRAYDPSATSAQADDSGSAAAALDELGVDERGERAPERRAPERVVVDQPVACRAQAHALGAPPRGATTRPAPPRRSGSATRSRPGRSTPCRRRSDRFVQSR